MYWKHSISTTIVFNSEPANTDYKYILNELKSCVDVKHNHTPQARVCDSLLAVSVITGSEVFQLMLKINFKLILYSDQSARALIGV